MTLQQAIKLLTTTQYLVIHEEAKDFEQAKKLAIGAMIQWDLLCKLFPCLKDNPLSGETKD